MRRVKLQIDGVEVRVAAGSTVAAAILAAGKAVRRSISGEQRATLCGMGTCFECRATINNHPHVRACQQLVREGMVVRTS